ncbi:hypothetical protein B0H65DRAFT_554889 [Neurospora tetraspora]|uniref:Uncharacterized protein n=1 Tax=Neurospora tetraspora TaxID=94610 RepID=A0AAE0JQ83_9PEZI|nr:hypothetical protein B0H65DRAFT_554889 [Neurospora tetraspora]
MAITYISPRKLKTYYIDPSCDARFDNQFESFVREAMDYARRAVDRLTSDSDTDFARVYETLFKMPKSDTQRFNWGNNFRLMNPHSASVRMTAYEHVVGVLRDFATNWRKTHNHWEADVRFHCDAETRFHFLYLRSSDSFTSLDPPNFVFNTGSFPTNVTRQAFTSYKLSTEGANGEVRDLFGLTGIRGDSNVQNPARVVIDLCQETWEAFSDSTRANNDSASDLLEYRGKVDDVSKWSIPRIIFHEMMHCRYYGLDMDDTYAIALCSATCTSGWESCMNIPRGPSCVDAERYALLGFMARLADLRPEGEERGGYTLSRTDEGERVKGVVRFYEDVTR